MSCENILEHVFLIPEMQIIRSDFRNQILRHGGNVKMNWQITVVPDSVKITLQLQVTQYKLQSFWN